MGFNLLCCDAVHLLYDIESNTRAVTKVVFLFARIVVIELIRSEFEAVDVHAEEGGDSPEVVGALFDALESVDFFEALFAGLSSAKGVEGDAGGGLVLCRLRFKRILAVLDQSLGRSHDFALVDLLLKRGRQRRVLVKELQVEAQRALY